MLCGPTPRRPTAHPECREACRHSYITGGQHHGNAFYIHCCNLARTSAAMRPAEPGRSPMPGPAGPGEPSPLRHIGRARRQAQKRRTAGPYSTPAQQFRGIARTTRQAAVPRMPGPAQRRGMRRIYPAATRQTAALSVLPTKNSPTPESDSGKANNTLSPLDFLTHRHAG